jgi:hypothetical protein
MSEAEPVPLSALVAGALAPMSLTEFDEPVLRLILKYLPARKMGNFVCSSALCNRIAGDVVEDLVMNTYRGR